MVSDGDRDTGVPSPSRTQEGVAQEGEISDLACKSCKSNLAHVDEEQHVEAEDDAPSVRPEVCSRSLPAVEPQLLDFLSTGLTDHDDLASLHSDSSYISDTRFVRAISLSALVHPSHDVNLTPPSSVPSPNRRGFFLQLAGAQNTLQQVCESLDLSIASLQTLTDAYFDNMMAFSLFHQPSFGEKVQGIKNALHLKALLASMFSFSARFATAPGAESLPTLEAYSGPSHEQLHKSAMGFVNEAIEEYDDKPPPLCILQALILCTFYELTRGVRGRAWRMLGNCVRIAYEQRLHLVDSITQARPQPGTSGVAQWSAMEERRRSWWAIWQMDIFASTVHRLPTAIDHSVGMNENHLPVPDVMWFQNMYQPSCPLDPAPLERAKKLSKSGNTSDVAWFIVLNSIMRNAQVLARGNLHSVLSDLSPAPGADSRPLKQYLHGSFRKRQSAEDAQQLPVLIGALKQTVALLPRSLTYQGAQLGFKSTGSSSNSDCTQLPSERRSNASQHAIYLMIQLARFMIYHHFAFNEILLGTIFSETDSPPSFGWTSSSKDEKERLSNSEGLRNCLEASDDIHSIVSRSSETHIQWTNPFLASTVWLAASLQVLRKVFAPSTCNEASEMKIKELRAVCQKYTDFWGTPESLLQNLDSLEERLAQKKAEIAAIEATHMLGCASYQHAGHHTSAFNGTSSLQNFGLMMGPELDHNSLFTSVIPGHQGQDVPTPISPRNTSTDQGNWFVEGQHDGAEGTADGLGITGLNASDEFAGFPEGDPELSFFMSTLL
ncbi:hypothetical protein CSIM01_00610 [Colletotrichum simmondsii]|uniref:Xylanolytic transcriptional activator regulatory domain-containing protein n=1 Tax=Colletotrichum simmondsii TaxID=703756 RepID=A0A135SJ52_9PEZI|nr:hypothetical protein CSIM01_00610 [Colletotrichum simmondsii]